jgi:hypothetical protein
MADKRIIIMWDKETTPSPLPAGATLAGYSVTISTANTTATVVWQSGLVTDMSVEVPRIPAGRYSVDVREVATDATVQMRHIRADLDATDAPLPDSAPRMYQALAGVTFAVSDA